jgi:hypothetical protein
MANPQTRPHQRRLCHKNGRASRSAKCRSSLLSADSSLAARCACANYSAADSLVSDKRDNDTRVIFASTFDGTWDSYIDDFGTKIPNEIDLLFHECGGYPGIHSPKIKDWIVDQQVTAWAFYSAYPQATVRDVWKALKTRSALGELLDQA